MFRRSPDMTERAVPFAEALRRLFFFTAATLLVGGVFVAFDRSPGQAGAFFFIPVVYLHLQGVRHRWWAMGAAVLGGWLVVLAVDLVVDGWGRWDALLALIVGGVVGNVAYTAVTHVPARRVTSSRV